MITRTFTTALILFALITSAIAQHYVGGLVIPQESPMEFRDPESNCEELFTITDSWPSGLTSDGTNYWSNGFTDAFIYRTDVNGITLDSFPSPATNPLKGGGLYYENQVLWAVVEEDAMIYKLDAFTGELIEEFDLPTIGGPNNYGITGDGEHLWHTEYFVGEYTRVYKLNPSDMSVIDTFSLDQPLFLGITYWDGFLYLTNIENDYLVKVDPITYEQVADYNLCESQIIDLNVDQNGFQLLRSRRFDEKDGKVYIEPTITDVDDITEFQEEINIFPNPAQDRLTISISENFTIDGTIDCSLISASGKLIFSELALAIIPGGTATIPLENLPSGIYFLQVRSGTLQRIQKIVVH